MTNQSLKNSINRNSGNEFERIVTNACEYYKEKKVAIIDKTPEPLRVIKNNQNGTMTAVFTKKAQPDYKGTLIGGKAIIFEAKYTSKEEIKQSCITDVQEEYLDLYQSMGALCYVMVSLGYETYYRVPWDVFGNMKKIYGRKYMKKEELKKYEIKMKRNVLLMLENIKYQA